MKIYYTRRERHTALLTGNHKHIFSFGKISKNPLKSAPGFAII